MDVNNTPYFLLRSEAEFKQGSSYLQWNRAQQGLTLAQNQRLQLPAVNATNALTEWQNSTPLALDNFNQIGRLSGDRTLVEFNSGRDFKPLQDGGLKNLTAPLGRFNDMALSSEARLALPYTDGGSQHGLLLFHLGSRWQTSCDLSADLDGVPLSAPLRACIDCDNQVWLVTSEQLLLCSGEPLPLPYKTQDSRFEPEQINPHELQLLWNQSLPNGWQPLAICCDDSYLYLLVHDGAENQAILTRARNCQPDEDFQVFACDAAAPFVIDLALATDSRNPVPGRLAALAPRQADDEYFKQRDATIFELHWDTETASGSAQLVHERYPLLSLAMPRFVSSADGQLRYQADSDPDFPTVNPRPRELHALRRPRYHLEGTALLTEVLDSGSVDTVWHRLYLDANIPSGCAIQIAVRVFASPEQQGTAPLIPQPAPLWNPLPSELPFADSLAKHNEGGSGLFEILLQRPAGPIRRVSGRYLQLQVTLQSNGRQTPCLHAIRVYRPRFSYQEAYLPELYRQELSYDPENENGSANGADTRERLLAAFEGILTPLEGRIAASAQLVHPDSAPQSHLAWLSEALGTTLPGHWPEPRQRRLVHQATLIQQYKGTLYGVNLALDIASDGGIQRGEIVLVENFRLRRTMATILGVSMNDAEHPLTLGTGMSGNSIVGDSLILSESDAREFLALFSPELANADEAAAVKAFFEQYAHQVTVLLHGRAIKLHSMVEELLVEQMPAHLQWQVFETEHPFVLGLAPLLTIDSFIETTPEARRVQLDDTCLGREGVLKNRAAFSPADINVLSL